MNASRFLTIKRPDTAPRPNPDGEEGKLAIWRRIGQFREASILALLAILLLGFRANSPSFWSSANIRGILLGVALLLVVSVGQTVVILSRNFDLSVGSTVGLSAMTVGLLLKNHPGMPSGVGFLAAIGVGAIVGVVNGVLITVLRVPSIILTLGMLSVIRGLVYAVANGQQVNPNDVPRRFVDLSITSAVGIPGIVLIAAGVAILATAALTWTRQGRSVYALGSNPDAAQLRGLPTRKIIFGTFLLSGALAGLGGAIFLSQYGLVQVNAGTGIEFQTITAVIIGGASVFGGAGTILGTTLGCLLLATIGNGLAIAGLSSFWQDTAYGGLLLVAVLADAVVRSARASRILVRPELKL